MTIQLDDLVLTPPQSLLPYDAPELIENMSTTKRPRIHELLSLMYCIDPFEV
jgi:hypothetical protein